MAKKDKNPTSMKIPKYKGHKKIIAAEEERIKNAKGTHIGAGKGSSAQRIAVILALKEGKVRKKRKQHEQDVKKGKRPDAPEALKRVTGYGKFKIKGNAGGKKQKK